MTEEYYEVNDEMKEIAHIIIDILHKKYPKEPLRALAILSFTQQILEETLGAETGAIIIIPEKEGK